MGDEAGHGGGPLIVGVGVDSVPVGRMEEVVRRRGKRFLERVFTPEELSYCLSMARPQIHLAARFAAKEAVMKALGRGLVSGIGFGEIRVQREPGGRPSVDLVGRARDRARSLGVSHVHLSLTHTEDMAIAFAVAEKT